MDLPEAQRQGFALAATIAGDTAAARAAAGLAPAVRATLMALPEALAQAPKSERRQRVRALAEQASEARTGGVLEGDPRDRLPRALSLLSTGTDRERGSAWLSAASLPRPGFRAEPALLLRLRLLASRPSQR